MDEIDLGEVSGPVDKPHSSDSKPNNDLDADANDGLALNKATEHNLRGVVELCEVCFKSKHTRIVKSKKMTPTTRRLQDVHANLWGLHEPAFIWVTIT